LLKPEVGEENERSKENRMTWVLLVLSAYLGFIWVLTSNYQVVTLWLGMYLANVDSDQSESTGLGWSTIQNLITPKGQTNRQFARLLLPIVIIAGFIVSVNIGLWCLGIAVGTVLVTKVLLPKGQKFYIDNILKSLDTRISSPQNKYDKANREALQHTKRLLDGYVEHSDMKNLTLRGLREHIRVASHG
jgi:hypothetical protein